MSRICIVGAGAVGGLLGTRLAGRGVADVSGLARGAPLAPLLEHGWGRETDVGVAQAPARCADDAGSLGHQDLVVLTVKAHALPALAPRLTPLLGPDTVVLPLMNGVPWWFSHGTPLGDEPLHTVDPG